MLGPRGPAPSVAGRRGRDPAAAGHGQAPMEAEMWDLAVNQEDGGGAQPLFVARPPPARRAPHHCACIEPARRMWNPRTAAAPNPSSSTRSCRQPGGPGRYLRGRRRTASLPDARPCRSFAGAVLGTPSAPMPAIDPRLIGRESDWEP